MFTLTVTFIYYLRLFGGGGKHVTKGLTKKEKVKALMDFFGVSRKEALAELEDMGE